jgi:hypothetical protein
MGNISQIHGVVMHTGHRNLKFLKLAHILRGERKEIELHFLPQLKDFGTGITWLYGLDMVPGF